MNEQYSVDDFYQGCAFFNTVAGKDKPTSKQDLLNQIKIIESEVAELREGIELNDAEEVLDGAIDSAVTVFGMLQMLENIGFDVQRASAKTVVNNITKFPDSEQVAKDTVALDPENLRYESFQMYDPVETVYIIKDKNDKVRKPVGYQKNDLSDCLPADYQEKFGD